MQFERGTKPPSAWIKDEYGISESWKVYDAKDNHVFCFLSPLHGGKINSSQAIAEVMKNYAGDWPYVSAELITWDDLLPGQEEYLSACRQYSADRWHDAAG